MQRFGDSAYALQLRWLAAFLSSRTLLSASSRVQPSSPLHRKRLRGLAVTLLDTRTIVKGFRLVRVTVVTSGVCGEAHPYVLDHIR